MSTWQEGDASTNGIRLHYYRTGTGDKPAVVLLHGITDSGLCWTPVAQVLENDYDVIMVDARGHGKSDAPPAGYASADHAADILGLLDALALERPSLLGHSMGASNAAAAAALAPERVRCLLLEDPPWRPASEANTPAQNAAFAAQWRANLLAEKAKSRDELIALQRTRSSWQAAELGPWADSKRDVSANVMGYVEAQPLDWADAVSRITAPILLITGETAIVPDAVADEVVRRAPNARRAHILAAGHNIRRDQFDAFMGAVREFLRQNTHQQAR